MKAEINKYGKLHLLPETTTEAYALAQWWGASVIYQEDPQRHEQFHFRGSKIMIVEAK